MFSRGPSESLQEYTAQFKEETIKASHLNQEMFVGDFQNGLRACHFNEFMAQKMASNMDEVMNWVECYIKGQKSNMEKRHQDAKERAPSRSEGGTSRKEK